MADAKVALEDLDSDSSDTVQREVPPRSLSFSRRWALLVLAPVLAAAAYFVVQSQRTSSEPLRALPLTSLQGVMRSPSLSPDGNFVAFTWTGPKQDNADIYIQQIGAGSPHRLTIDPSNDYSPSWSPDGRTIAFLRREPAGPRTDVRLIAPLGGSERKLADIQPLMPSYRPHSLAWCPDSRCVVVTDSAGPGKPDAVFAIALNSGEKRQLTYPQGQVVDADPAISSDGRSLVFRRDSTPFSGTFYRVSLKGRTVPEGEPVRLTATLRAGKPAWMPDSRAVLFAARGALWRFDALGGGTPTRLPFVGQDGLTPVVSRTPDGRQRLVYVRSFADANVWRVDTSAAGAPASSPPVAAIASTRSDHIPNLSPDGRRLVFSSDRSGETEFWLADLDGSNAVQLTSMAILPGFPRWSPDGRLIAFHGDPDGRPDVLVVPTDGGSPRIMTATMPNGGFPSFSRDGQWIYFTVVRNGEARIWKIPASGGAAVQVTNNAGALAIESHDGRDLYYVEAAERPSSLWRLPPIGGAPVKVLDGVVLGNFDVVEGGIYYIDRLSGEAGVQLTGPPSGETRLQYFDFATGQSTTVARNLGSVGFGLSASPDGRTIFFSRVDSSVDELMLVENFR
jgi:Tol biopolymer transport system component